MAEGFPKGAAVRFMGRTHFAAFKYGEVYIVGGIYHERYPDFVCVEKGENGRPDGCHASNFELAGGPW